MTLAAYSQETADRTRWKSAIAAAIFLALTVFVLDLPGHPDAVTLPAFLRLPLEAPGFALLLLLLPATHARRLAMMLTLALSVILLLKLADLGTQAAFQRVFNPYLDIRMLRDGWDLFARAAGPAVAVSTLAAALLVLIAVVSAFHRAARHLANLSRQRHRRLALSLGLISALGIALLPGWGGMSGWAEAKAGAYLVRRVGLIVTSFADMRRFEAELAAPVPIPAGAFDAVRGRDVVVIFVESYGRSAIEDARYAPLIRPRLQGIEGALREAGLFSASGWLTSPTVGGLSWLAHASLLSGLWIDSQARYDRLMQSDRASLNRLFSAAGWQSTAIMPAITRDWPDAGWFGYDRIFTANDLGYRGKPFNWVTMPDQYTLSAFERLARQPARSQGRAVMAEIALISSHAPWTPVPRPLDWASIGDGSVFSAQAVSGDTPAKVWSDRSQIRRHYIKTIDYSLTVLGQYLSAFAGDGIFIIVGDHQPAAIITGPDASRAVPVHVVSSDRTLEKRLRQKGFAAGMTPPGTGAEQPMSAFRDILLGVQVK